MRLAAYALSLSVLFLAFELYGFVIPHFISAEHYKPRGQRAQECTYNINIVEATTSIAEMAA